MNIKKYNEIADKNKSAPAPILNAGTEIPKRSNKASPKISKIKLITSTPTVTLIANIFLTTSLASLVSDKKIEMIKNGVSRKKNLMKVEKNSEPNSSIAASPL